MTPKCESFFCQAPLRFYNIGFDDGYVCDKCGRLYEVYDKTGRRRDADPNPKYYDDGQANIRKVGK